MVDKSDNIDPEVARWNRKYPGFPGVAASVELLRRSNVRGAWVDIICWELQRHAHGHTDELLAATREEVSRGSEVARILLYIVAGAKMPEALPLFAELLNVSDDTLREFATNGLVKLDSKESLRILWEHRSK